MFSKLKKSFRLTKRNELEIEQKSFSNNAIFIDSDGKLFTYANSALQYLYYYSYVAPVGDAVNKIASAASDIKILKYNSHSFKPDYDNHFYKVMGNPNPEQTYSDFFKDLYVDYLVTGNHYLYVSVNSFNEILELYNLNPAGISIEEDEFGQATKYTYNKENTGIGMFFTKKSVKINGKNRDLFKEKNKNAYLFHFKEPSKNPKISRSYGDSLLGSIQLEAEQYLQASQYNTNMVLNGFNAKILLSPKDDLKLNTEQRDIIREQLKNYYSGSSNSGNNAILAHIPMSAQFIGYNSKDMDFSELMQRMRVAVYNKYNVALPLVEGDYTANANMKQSDTQFYDKAIIPLVNLICQRLDKIESIFLGNDFYGEFGFKKFEIPALQERLIMNSSQIAKNRSYTLNDIREYLGKEKLEGGADALFVDANSIAVAGDISFTKDLYGSLRQITSSDLLDKPDSNNENSV